MNRGQILLFVVLFGLLVPAMTLDSAHTAATTDESLENVTMNQTLIYPDENRSNASFTTKEYIEPIWMPYVPAVNNLARWGYHNPFWGHVIAGVLWTACLAVAWRELWQVYDATREIP